MSSKKKGITVPLPEFLGDKKITSWAEDEDYDADLPVFPSPSRPGAAAAAEPARNDFTSMPGLPDQPPYKVYLGNVPYELTKEDLSDVFKDLQIRDTHFLTHRDTGKLKGVFVEFSSKDGLQAALQMNGTSVLGRALRIDVAEARPERSRGGFGDKDQGGYGFDRPDYVAADRGSDRTKGGGYSRDYESSDRSRSGGGGFRDDRGGYADRSQPDRNDRRGFGNNFDQEDRRSGSFRDRPRGDYGGFSGARDESQGRWGKEPQPEVTGAPGEALSGGPRGSDSASQLERTPSEQQRSLTLQPVASSTTAGENTKPKSNPFGSAKPVDTVARLKELEERDAKRKAEEAQKRRETAAAAHAGGSQQQQPSQAGPTKILKPPASSEQAAQTAKPQAQQEQPPTREQTPQANGSVPTSSQSRSPSVPAPVLQQPPKAAAAEAASAPAAAAAKPEAPKAPAWGKPALFTNGTKPQSSAQPKQADTATTLADKSPKTASTAQQAECQQPAAAPGQAGETSKDSPGGAKPEKKGWGKAGDSGPAAAGQAPASSQPPSAWGKPKAPQDQAPMQDKAQTSNTSEAAGQSQTESAQPEGQAPAPSEAGKQASDSQPDSSVTTETPNEDDRKAAAVPVTGQAGWGDEQPEAKAPGGGAQTAASRGGPTTLPLTGTTRPHQNRQHQQHHHQQQQQHHQQQQRNQPRRPQSFAPAAGDNGGAAPTAPGVGVASESGQQADQDGAGQDAGWVEVGSTRSSGGQDGGSASLEAGRGRARGRGRGRGRYDQDASGRGGPADRFAVRGPGRGRGGGRYESQRGGGRGQGRVSQYQGQDRAAQGSVVAPPGLQGAKAEAEEGWEQPGRAGSSRSAHGRGSATPHILQRPNKPTAAWANAPASQTNVGPQARAPPGLAAQPEAQQSEASNPFDLLGEGQ